MNRDRKYVCVVCAGRQWMKGEKEAGREVGGKRKRKIQLSITST